MTKPKVIEWPCDLSPKLKQALLNIAKDNYNLEDTGIVANFWVLRGVFYVRSGTAKICLMSQDSTKLVGSVIGTGDWIGAATVEGANKFDLYVEQLKTMNLLFFPASKIRVLSKQYPEIYKWLYFCLNKIQPKWIQSQLTSLHSIEHKVIYHLFSIASHSTQLSGVLPNVRVTQQQLSEICGVTRPRVNEVLKNLEGSGIVAVSRGTIHLLNLTELSLRISDLNMAFHNPTLEPNIGK